MSFHRRRGMKSLRRFKVQGSRNKSRDRGSENYRVRARDSCSTLTIKRLGETVKHLNDPIILRAGYATTLFICFPSDKSYPRTRNTNTFVTATAVPIVPDVSVPANARAGSASVTGAIGLRQCLRRLRTEMMIALVFGFLLSL